MVSEVFGVFPGPSETQNLEWSSQTARAPEASKVWALSPPAYVTKYEYGGVRSVRGIEGRQSL